MSDYTKTYDGAAKDLNNAVISGADFDVEFSAISAMSQTKVDKVVPAVTNNIALLGASGSLVDGGKGIPVGAIVGTSDSQTLTNKTLTTPTINGATLSGTFSGNPTFSGNVRIKSLRVDDTGGDHYLQVVLNENLSANRALNIVTGNASRNLTLSGNATLVAGTMVPTTTGITAGNGLTGGGDFSTTRTVTLGTPSTVTNSTTNSVTSTSHTHAMSIGNGYITNAMVGNGQIGAEKFQTGTAERDWILSRLASASFGTIGTYAWARRSGTTGYNAGSIVSGSLVPAGFEAGNPAAQTGTSLAGSWMVMGFVNPGGTQNWAYTLFLRVA